MARFTLPRDLYHGPKALEALKTLPGKRAMICGRCAARHTSAPSPPPPALLLR